MTGVLLNNTVLFNGVPLVMTEIVFNNVVAKKYNDSRYQLEFSFIQSELPFLSTHFYSPFGQIVAMTGLAASAPPPTITIVGSGFYIDPDFLYNG